MFLTRNYLLTKDKLPKVMNEPYIRKAIAVLYEMNFIEEELSAYEDHNEWFMGTASAIFWVFSPGGRASLLGDG